MLFPLLLYVVPIAGRGGRHDDNLKSFADKTVSRIFRALTAHLVRIWKYQDLTYTTRDLYLTHRTSTVTSPEWPWTSLSEPERRFKSFGNAEHVSWLIELNYALH